MKHRRVAGQDGFAEALRENAARVLACLVEAGPRNATRGLRACANRVASKPRSLDLALIRPKEDDASFPTPQKLSKTVFASSPRRRPAKCFPRGDAGPSSVAHAGARRPLS